MSKPKNPYWGHWDVNWDDPREAADALGEGYYKERITRWEDNDEELPEGFHVVEEPEE